MAVVDGWTEAYYERFTWAGGGDRPLVVSYGTSPPAEVIYADPPVDGKVILDFNQVYNPPCAFTAYATCPLPPGMYGVSRCVGPEPVEEAVQRGLVGEAPAEHGPDLVLGYSDVTKLLEQILGRHESGDAHLVLPVGHLRRSHWRRQVPPAQRNAGHKASSEEDEPAVTPRRVPAHAPSSPPRCAA